jgi:flagellar basal-body rod protein FlgB
MAAPLPALFQLLSARAGFLQARHAVLAQNLANADTPRYQPQDLVEPDFEALLRGGPGSTPPVAVARTRSAHLAGASPGAASPRQRPIEAFETAPAGNAVIIEEQIRLMGQADRGYQLATNLYGKYVGMMRTALGVGGA